MPSSVLKMRDNGVFPNPVPLVFHKTCDQISVLIIMYLNTYKKDLVAGTQSFHFIRPGGVCRLLSMWCGGVLLC